MKKLNPLLIALILLSFSSLAKEKASVMIMGTFHFTNPGADVVKAEQINVMTESNQQYLDSLTTKISDDYAPTHVLLECDPNEQDKYDLEFQQYIDGKFTLESNEDYQLGFRIGLKSKAKVICYDEREVMWNGADVTQWLSKENGKEKQAFDKIIKELSQHTENMHKTMSLSQILTASNDKEQDALNKSLYMGLNHIGSGKNFEGADSAASWWHRNFRMYANIQHHAQPGSRVFVIGGQGHTAIFKDMLAMDPKRNAESVLPFLNQ